MAKSDTPVVDMTNVKRIGPLDPTRPYVLAVAGWKYGTSGSGNPKVDTEMSVVQPEGINQKIFASINLEEPYSIARVQDILVAIGEFGSEEDIKASKKFTMPPSDEVIGMQFGAWLRTEKDKTGEYQDKSVIKGTFPVDQYEELASKPGL